MGSKKAKDHYSTVTIDSDDSPVGGDEDMVPKKSDKKIQKLKDHVSEVTNVMQENINKILERGQRLDQLEDRSEILTSRADEFRVSSRRVSRKMWWQNTRLNIIIAGVVVVVVVIIIVSVTSTSK